MKPNNWKGTAELIGIAAIVVSLVFVGTQIRQDQDIALAQISLTTMTPKSNGLG